VRSLALAFSTRATAATAGLEWEPPIPLCRSGRPLGGGVARAGGRRAPRAALIESGARLAKLCFW